MSKQRKHLRTYWKGKMRGHKFVAGSRQFTTRINPMLAEQVKNDWILDSPEWTAEYMLKNSS
jgi:hypothetical protein